MFSPAEHSFIPLDFAFPGGVKVFEHFREGIDHTKHDMMRLNTYLSQDGDFVTVWWGLIDSVMVEMKLGFFNDDNFRFHQTYDEPLFRGYISDNETGDTILNALRFEQTTPNILSLSKDGKLECNALKLME
jgi:hypothetical protein